MIIYGSGKGGRIHRNVQPTQESIAREQMKTCNRCCKVLPITEYSKCKKMKSGIANTCKKCVAERERKRKERKRRLEQAQLDGSKVCRACGIEKPFSEFYLHPDTKDRHDNRCKQCRLAIKKQRQEAQV